MHLSSLQIRLDGDLGVWKSELIEQSAVEGVRLVTLRLTTTSAIAPPRVSLIWEVPLRDTAARWNPATSANRGLPPFWGGGQLRSAVTQQAPVQCFYSLDGRNQMTFACSDALNVIELNGGVHEETAELKCSLKLFTDDHPPISKYEVTLRIDLRDIPWQQPLQDVARWWAEQPGYTPCDVPDLALRPMYSTWYSYHQTLVPAEIVRECELARDLGCEAVIVDDGWQTKDASRGYAHCGDWNPLRIPDMRGFVDAVHATGMKFLLWYAVPFIGKESVAFAQFKDKFLRFDERIGAGVLDPRFPEVRTYLIELYERHLREWDLDGFKLDFVDAFRPTPGHGEGRDIDSVPMAADRLLSDVMTRLRAIKPDIMIEFRQSYIGPLMRKYGNMFRAGDCPADFVGNRIHTIDIRLLCGDTAAHADMLMWHLDESPESAALQFINILFSVPQISVRLEQLPESHRQMLQFWLAFWNQHRDVLMHGEFEPLNPASLYSVVRASTKSKRIVAVYDSAIAEIGATVPPELHIVNGTRNEQIVVNLATAAGSRRVVTRDCTGRVVKDEVVKFDAGIHALRVPMSGLASLTTA